MEIHMKRRTMPIVLDFGHFQILPLFLKRDWKSWDLQIWHSPKLDLLARDLSSVAALSRNALPTVCWLVTGILIGFVALIWFTPNAFIWSVIFCNCNCCCCSFILFILSFSKPRKLSSSNLEPWLVSLNCFAMLIPGKSSFLFGFVFHLLCFRKYFVS